MTSSRTAPAATGRSWAALGVLTLAVMLLAIDGTVLTLAIPALTADLAPSASQILWIGDIYSFTLSGLLVVMGNLADRIGRKRLLMIGSVGFGLSSLLAAFATSPELLIAARALLGISGATIMPSTLAIIRSLFPDKQQRTRAIAIWSAGTMAGAAIGPIIGGALLEHFPWGSVFLINVPVMILVVAGGLWLLPESRNPGKGRIDLLSAVLSMVAIVSLVQAVKEVFSAGPTPTAVVALALGLVTGWWFLRRQRSLTTPLIDISLFRNRAFTAAVTADTVTIFAFVGLLFFFSQYLQLVRGLSPLQAGLLELSGTVAAIVVVAFTGIAVRRLGTGGAISAGLGLGSVGLVILVFAESATGLVGIIIAFALVGFGIGLSMTLNTDAIVGAVPAERAGAASSIAETAYELGTALGIALLGSVHTALYRAALPPDTGPELRESLASAISQLGPADPALAGARHTFTTAMQWTSAGAAVLLAATAVLAWFTIPRTTPSDEEAIPDEAPRTDVESSVR
ncbi:MFS transporter [[Pseudopropionibacterium] massiliense]|uniref:MFS transporter n=1 Tax=[Pseudopropionibacterium] massiliense TaxID=2220000 RepID=UPI0010303B0A|nr:MFS transporter [[Pseudopropionibacterium] massiliense]